MRLKNKGIAITEVLIAAAILSFISVAMLKTLDISLLSSNVANSLLADADLKIALYNTLDHTDGQCKTNLHPDKFSPSGSNTLNSLTRYEVPIAPTSPTGVELIKKDELFREYLKIVKLELAGTGLQREFKVYYTRERAKNLKTRDGNPCTATDTSGCYENICQMEYKLNSAGTDVDTCTLLNCSGLRSGGGGGGGGGGGQAASVNAECYKVTDTGQSPEEVTLVGCGTTEDITKKTTVAFGFNAGGSGVSGGGNTFVGYEAGKNTTSGNLNVFIGNHAGRQNTTGQNQTFIGNQAGQANTRGEQNTFVGSAAGVHNSTGSWNSFFGFEVGYGNTIGKNNSYFGHNAGYDNSSGKNNSFFGNNAGKKSTGSGNSFFGNYSGQNTTTGSGNIFIGDNAGNLADYQTASNKFIVGNNANPTDPDATRDWIVGEIGTDTFTINGKQVSYTGTFDENNTFYGFEAGEDNTGGIYNSFFGSKAGHTNTNGYQNTFVGNRAGGSNTTGNNNTFVGHMVGNSNTTGEQNTFVGSAAGYNNTEGHFNNFFGNYAGGSNTTGNNNNFFGYYAGGSNTTGYQNNFFGSGVGNNNTTGYQNTFVGNRAGGSNTTGNNNTFVGNRAGDSNTTGYQNNFFGNRAGNGNTTGYQNNFFGNRAGSSNSTGNNNNFIGNQAGQNTTTGNNNIFIGNQAGSWNTTLSGNIFIGNEAGNHVDYQTESNMFVVGSNKGWIVGQIGTGRFEINGHQVCLTDGTGCVHSHSHSSKTLKKNIKPFKNFKKALEDILNTSLFTYQYKDKKIYNSKKRMGVVSEELPKNLQIKEKGKVSRPDWPSIYGTLWAGIKALHKIVLDFKNEINSQINSLTETLNSQLKQIKNLSLKYENVSVEQKEIKALIIKNTKELEALKKENKALKQKIIQITNKSD